MSSIYKKKVVDFSGIYFLSFPGQPMKHTMHLLLKPKATAINQVYHTPPLPAAGTHKVGMCNYVNYHFSIIQIIYGRPIV